MAWILNGRYKHPYLSRKKFSQKVDNFLDFIPYIGYYVYRIVLHLNNLSGLEGKVMTKQFIVLVRYPYQPHATVLNSALFNSKQMAEKVAKYSKLKLETERKLSESYWKEKQATDLPTMEIVEISIPDKFWKD